MSAAIKVRILSEKSTRERCSGYDSGNEKESKRRAVERCVHIREPRRAIYSSGVSVTTCCLYLIDVAEGAVCGGPLLLCPLPCVAFATTMCDRREKKRRHERWIE